MHMCILMCMACVQVLDCPARVHDAEAAYGGNEDDEEQSRFVEPALLAGGGFVQVTRATGAGCRLAAASAVSREEAPFTPHAL